MNILPVSSFFGQQGIAADELLLHIHENLPIKDQASLALVDQRFAQLFSDNAIWKLNLSRDYDFSLPLEEGLGDEKTKNFFLREYRTLVDVPKVIKITKMGQSPYKVILQCDAGLTASIRCGNIVYTGSKNGSVKAWDVKTQQEILLFLPSQDPSGEKKVWSLAVNENFLFAHTIDAHLKVWNRTDRKEVFSLEKVKSFGADGDFFYMQMVGENMDGENKVRVLNKDFEEEDFTPFNEPITCFAVHQGKIYGVTKQNDILIVSLSDKKQIGIIKWDQLTEERTSRKYVGRGTPIGSIKIQGKFLFVTIGGGFITWDLNKSKEFDCGAGNSEYETSMGDIYFFYNPMQNAIGAHHPSFTAQITNSRIVSVLPDPFRVVCLQTFGHTLWASTFDGKIREFDFSTSD